MIDKDKKIVIDDNYYIEFDPYQCILRFEGEPYIGTSGLVAGKKCIPKNEWYYPSIKMALQRYVKEVPRNAGSIQEVIDITNKAIETIEKLDI